MTQHLKVPRPQSLEQFFPHVLRFNENELERQANAELKINGVFHVVFRLPEENEGHFLLQAPNFCSLVWLHNTLQHKTSKK